MQCMHSVRNIQTFMCQGERKEGHLENEVEPMRSAAENFGEQATKTFQRHRI